MLLRAVVSKLNQLADPSLAESWDNVGLLVEPSDADKRRVTSVLLTNDLTESVVREAKDKDADMIVSYHPPIFAPLKRLSSSKWKDRCILRCIEERIAVYSPHTAHDAVAGGVNDWLASAFPGADVSVITQSTGFRAGWKYRVTLVSPSLRVIDLLRQDLPAVFLPEEQANGWLSTWIANRESSEDQSLASATFFCDNDKSEIARVESLLRDELYRDIKSHVTKLEPKALPDTGMGRLCRLAEQKTSLRAVVERIKVHLGLGSVQVALADGKTLDSPVKTIALCAGSGSSVLRGIAADVYWTGEMSHHDVLDAVNAGKVGVGVVLCGHSNTERGYLDQFAAVLRQALDSSAGDGANVKVLVSEKDRDPLQII